MYKISELTVCIVVLISLMMLDLSAVRAEDIGFHPPLSLKCSAVFSNYNGVKHAATFIDVTLSQPKHNPGGMILATQTKDYEFWVMSHGVQTLNNKRFINNFQVAIRDKATGLFMHALSDTSHNADNPPEHARICLVDYHNESNLEKGELCFSCSRVK
jgi:hypothetical protein